MLGRFALLSLFIISNFFFFNCVSKKVSCIITERPVVTYTNSSYTDSFSIISRRHNRKDPRYYVNVYIQTLVPVSNNIKMNLYFYQFLTNRYQPSFVNMHFGFCDMIDKDPYFGSQLKRNMLLLNLTCPYPPGRYNLTDMAIPIVPKNFPFRRGRIYLNMTYVLNKVTTEFLRAYIDMELKDVNID